MPRIIRKAWVEEILSSAEAREALRDLAVAGGVSVRFMTAFGEEVRGSAELPPIPGLCRWMLDDPGGRRICTRVIHGVMDQAGSSSCGVVCPAGLLEAAVPFRMGGEVIGYVVLGQVAEGDADTVQINRWRHALEREGSGADRELLEPLRAAAPRIERERFEAVVRLTQRTVRHLETVLGRAWSGSQKDRMPGGVRRALAYMQGHFREPLALADLAHETGMSRQHFCTLFHKSTGMGFTDYLNWIRIEEAVRLLTHTSDSITDIAFASGFQSISQFNRVFRQIRKVSPRQYRHEQEAAESPE